MNRLFSRLQDESGRIFGSPGARIVPLACELRESSEVARAKVMTPSTSLHVFAKVFRPRPGEADDAATRARFRHDCAVTRSVFESMQFTADLRAVEPLACYEDVLGMVTKEAPGLPLSTAIAKYAAWGATSRLEYLERALSRVGRWVHEFQRVAPRAEPSRLNLDALRAYIDERLQKLTRLPRAHFSEVDRRTVLAYFDRLAAAVPSVNLFEVPVHGDMVPSNVLIDTNVVTVLDFGMTARGSSYLDVARLYTQVGFYRAKPQYRRHVISRLQQTALAGFEPGLRDDDPLFEICVLQHMVCHFLSHARQPGRFPASLYSAHLIRRHRRWFRDRSDRDTGPRTRRDTASTSTVS